MSWVGKLNIILLFFFPPPSLGSPEMPCCGYHLLLSFVRWGPRWLTLFNIFGSSGMPGSCPVADGTLGQHWVTLSLPPQINALPPPFLTGHSQLWLSYPAMTSHGLQLLMPVLREWNGNWLKGPGIILSFLSPPTLTLGSCEKLRPGCLAVLRLLSYSAVPSPMTSQQPSSGLGDTLK